MRIGIDARTLTLSEIRGIGTYLLEVLNAWPKSSKKDTFILFVEERSFPKLPSNQKIKFEVKKIKSPRGTRFRIWEWYALPKAIKQYSLDIFWSPANIAFPIINPIQIVTIHDTLLQEYVQFDSLFEKVYFRKIIPFFTRNYVRHIITVSSFSANRINYIFSYPKEHITIIYNGIPDIQKKFSSKKEAQNFLARENIVKPPYIYALGAESPWKNTKVLLEAFQKVQSKISNISLIISGIQSRSINIFKNLSQKFNLNESRVKLLEFIPNELKYILYQGAEIFIYPSLFEGFGFPPLEAMALGVPVIASNAASIPEVVGEAALLIDARYPNNITEAIVKILTNEELKFKLVKLGFENVKRFDWHKSATEHCILFKKSFELNSNTKNEF